MKLFFPIFCVFIVAFATGCAFEHKKKQDGLAISTGAIERAVSYSEAYQAVLSPRCVSCHGAGGGNQGSINLETFESTFPLAARIEKAALKDKTMPKGATLSDSEAAILGAWISRGATRNGSASTSPKLRGAVSWAIVREEIFEQKCLDCHSLPRPEKNLDLSSLDQVKANISKIFDRAVVLQDMPLAPVEHLTLEEKQALAQWIALGMPE